jgi:hypothetical protein
MLAALPKGPIAPMLGDAETIWLEKRFPVLLSTGMLEFVRDPAAALANAARHAEADARFVILVPQANVFGIGIHLFDRTWFETTAPRSGWQVHAVARILPFSLVIRLHRVR